MSTPYIIIGAGAIGGILGAHLIKAGCPVIFVEANEKHREAIRREGLKITGMADFTVPAEVFAPSDFEGPLEKVLLAVKSRHTLDALTPFAARIAEGGFVVSLQNGLEEQKIVKLVGPHRTIGAYITFGGYYAEPGTLVHMSSGSLYLGELDGSTTPRVEALADDFRALQPINITDNIQGYLWAKEALGAAYFATALADADVSDIYADDHYCRILGRLAGEVVAIAQAAGISVETTDGFDPKCFAPGAARDADAVKATWDAQRAYWARIPNGRTGVWRDLAIHHRKTEADDLFGPILATARAHDIRTPHLETLMVMVSEAEAGTRTLGFQNLEELAAVTDS